MFDLKTILTTLISTGFASSLVALPVRANEDTLVKPVNDELILSQVDYGNRYSNEPSDSLKNAVGLGVLAIGTGVIGYHVSRAYKPSLVNSLPTINSGSSATLLARVSPKLRQDLLRLVHNQQTANRLLNGTYRSHPGRSANWIAEKVIYDLKRDR
ncbi:MAG: hypothetical protein AAF383_29490 [Cyanobacteria bacterium P01_A01_bin.83]